MSAQNPNNDGAFVSAAFHASVSDTTVWISASIAGAPPTRTRAIRAPDLSMPLRLVAITRAAEHRPEVSGFIEQLRRGHRNHAEQTSGDR